MVKGEQGSIQIRPENQDTWILADKLAKIKKKPRMSRSDLIFKLLDDYINELRLLVGSGILADDYETILAGRED